MKEFEIESCGGGRIHAIDTGQIAVQTICCRCLSPGPGDDGRRLHPQQAAAEAEAGRASRELREFAASAHDVLASEPEVLVREMREWMKRREGCDQAGLSGAC